MNRKKYRAKRVDSRPVTSRDKVRLSIYSIASLIIGSIMLVQGIVNGVSWANYAHEDRDLIAEGARATGVITDIELNIRHGRGTESYTIFTVSFTAENGKTYTHIDDNEPYRSREDGDLEEVSKKWLDKEVTVLYDPSDPNNAVVEGWENSISMAYAGGILLSISGLGVLAFGFTNIRALFKAKTEQQILENTDA